MRKEELDPEGKVELAGLLLQIGFKREAVAEYIMAAEMYEELANQNRAKQLYKKVIELDPDNPTAKRALSKLLPPAEKDVDEMMNKMGFKPEEPLQETIQKEPPEEEETAEEEETEKEPAAQKEAKLEQAELEGIRGKKEEEAEKEEEEEEKEEELEEEPGPEIDVAGVDIGKEMAEIQSLIAGLPDDVKQRTRLARFFEDQGMWEEAFFEQKGVYLQSPSSDKLKELVELLLKAQKTKTLISLLESESRLERDKALKRSVLQALMDVYQKEGDKKQAKKVQDRLDKLEQKMSEKKKKQSIKIIEDVPRVSEEKDKSGGKKKPPGPIQFS